MLQQWRLQDVTATWGKLVDAVDIVSAIGGDDF